jgi:L-asparaginase
VVAGTGNGSLHHALESALLDAMGKGVRVVRASRCARGQVFSSEPAIPDSGGLSPVKARLALALELLGA